MLKYSLILFVPLALSASSNIAKLQMSCDIGNEKSCIELKQYLTLKNEQVKVKQETSTNSNTASITSKHKTGSCISRPHNLFIWKGHGITANEAREWACAGIDRRDARDWRKMGIQTADEAKAWLQLDVGLSTFRDLMRAGVKSPGAVQEWVNTGVLPQQIDHWIEKKVNSPKEARQWIEAGVSPSYTAEWKKSGISADEASQWNKIGIKDRYRIKDWKQLRIPPVEALKWKKLGLDTYSVKNWMSSGIKTAKQAKAWVSVGLKDNLLISKWIQGGLDSPQKAYQWLKAGFQDGHLWKKEGFSIEEAEQWKNMGISNGYKYKSEGIETLAEALAAKECRKVMNYKLFNENDKGVLHGRIIQSLPQGYIVSTDMNEIFFVPKLDGVLRRDNIYIKWQVQSRGERYTYNSVGKGVIQAAKVYYIDKNSCSKYIKLKEF